MHKYYYDLFDCTKENHKDWHQGRVYSKLEAESWVSETNNRSWHEKLICKLTGNKCSDLCQNYKIEK